MWHVVRCLTGHNGGVWKRPKDETNLRHLVLAGGSVDEWAAFTDSQWELRLETLFEVARQANVRFVTVHPHERLRQVPPSASAFAVRRIDLAGVTITVDPVVDGRERVRDVVRGWPEHRRLSEKSLGRALFGDAGEPDLVVVLGPPDVLPKSLVWELAYGELVFIDASWDECGLDHLSRAIDEYSLRQRRFGGVE